MLVYTSVTKSYLPKARVLAKSVKKYHPEWIFVLLFSDSLPEDFDLGQEPFDEVLLLEELGIENWQQWSFGHTIVELCTAVKGEAASLLAQRSDVDKIMYLDPDIKVFNDLGILDDLLEEHDVLLTPHLLDMECEISAIQDNEISALKHGVYNLGFFAAKTEGQGLAFIRWWAARLREFCIDDIPGGLFTDQRWCDLAPCFFDKLYILRDRGCNVATWNLAYRPLTRSSNGELYAADVLLRFYHFTGYDSGDGKGMLMRYAAQQQIAHELWREYHQDLLEAGQGQKSDARWCYGFFEDGSPVPNEARRLYRFRHDLQKAFPQPYATNFPSFKSWWETEGQQQVISDYTSRKRSVGWKAQAKRLLGRVMG